MIGRKLSRYRIEEKIGAGGMGEVYRAYDEHLERDVAIKILPERRLEDNDARERFRREALALSKLNHPNIQTIHDFESHDEMDFLVIEYVPGITLSDKLESGPLVVDEACGLAIQLAEGLDAAHRSGVVHRDLKPANLRVTPDGRLKILDFGLAKLIGEVNGSATTLSRFETQTFAGTPHYMSPEQKAGLPADARSDIYAAGIVLREMLGAAFVGDPMASTDLAAVVDKSVSLDRSDRYPSAAALLEALRAASASQGATASASELGSVVALPSDVLLGAREDDFLADAVPRTISSYLSRVPGLETKLPPSSAQLERFGGDIERIAAAYRVRALVMSSVTVQGTRLIVNVQLVETRSRSLVWSDEFDGLRSSYIQLVRQAADALRQELRPTVPPIIEVAGDSASSRVELAFQRGLYYSNRFNNLHQQADFDEALAAFRQTREFDPTLSDAAAEIAWLYEYQLEIGGPARDLIPQIDRWSRTALEIDSQNGRAWAALTIVAVGQGKVAESAVSTGLKAVHGAPRFARGHLALGYALDSSRLALAAFEASVFVDPLYLYAINGAAGMLADMGRASEAFEANERAVALEHDWPLGILSRATMSSLLGEHGEARRYLDQVEQMVAGGRIHPMWFQTALDTHRVLTNESRSDALERLLKTAGGETPFPWARGFAIIATHILGAQSHEREAKSMLLRVAESGAPPSYDVLLLSSNFAWVSGDPELEPVVASSRARFERTVRALEEARARGELPSYLEAGFDSLRAELGM